MITLLSPLFLSYCLLRNDDPDTVTSLRTALSSPTVTSCLRYQDHSPPGTSCIAYICDEKRPSPLSSLFRISSVDLRLSSANFDVVCDELFRLAATDTSCVWLLSTTEDFADLIKEKRDILESVFIISELDDIPSSHPLLAQADKTKERKNEALI